jgi:hypothetical protein
MNARITWGLLAAVLAVGALDVGVRVRQTLSAAPLPAIPPVSPTGPTKLTLTHSDAIVVLEKRGLAWQVTAPFDFPADKPSVKAILNLLVSGVPMDVEVDRGHFENYGLDQANAVLVEIAGEAGTITRFFVGENSDGGTTFVRFPDDDRVYRARLGGRTRFDHTASEWRDRRIFDLEAPTIDTITLERGADPGSPRLTFVRSMPADASAAPGPWMVEGSPDFPLDQAMVQDVAEGLAKLRAGEILPADAPFDVPVGVITLHTSAQETHRLRVARHEQGVFARRDDDPATYRIADAMAIRVDRPLPRWRDRTLFAIPPIRIRGLVFEDASLRTVLAFDAKAGAWTVTEPPNVAVDSREASQVAKALAGLRADDIAEVTAAEAGFPSKTRIGVTLEDGSVRWVEIGSLVPGIPAGRELSYVRTPDAPDRIGVFSATGLSRVRKTFSR